MKEILNFLILLGIFHSTLETIDEWRNYPACRLGRLQSPIQIKEFESNYTNDFSFVYQNYKPFKIKKEDNLDYAAVYIASENGKNGGYINFERGGVIKQYELEKFEIYPFLHSIDNDQGDFELHLVHKKNLDFKTNKNQYRNIQDANMYLVVVLRYSKECSDYPCTSDNGLLDKIITPNEVIDLNIYSIFQEKRAYFYEGSFLHLPCDENVNYYVVKDIFKTEKNKDDLHIEYESAKIKPANIFGRPIYKNFMNYKELMKSNYITIQTLTLFILIFILF